MHLVLMLCLNNYCALCKRHQLRIVTTRSIFWIPQTIVEHLDVNTKLFQPSVTTNSNMHSFRFMRWTKARIGLQMHPRSMFNNQDVTLSQTSIRSRTCLYPYAPCSRSIVVFFWIFWRFISIYLDKQCLNVEATLGFSRCQSSKPSNWMV